MLEFNCTIPVYDKPVDITVHVDVNDELNRKNCVPAIVEALEYYFGHDSNKVERTPDPIKNEDSFHYYGGIVFVVCDSLGMVWVNIPSKKTESIFKSKKAAIMYIRNNFMHY